MRKSRSGASSQRNGRASRAASLDRFIKRSSPAELLPVDAHVTETTGSDVKVEVDVVADEERDRELALRLQREFDFENRFHLNGLRSKTSSNPYALRRRRRGVNLEQEEQKAIGEFIETIASNNNY